MVSSFLTDAIVVAIVLGVMILVHELGHFLAAKSFGVRVLVLSLGFGKRLFGFKRRETDYRVSILPFGGYVKMAGDDPTETRAEEPGEFLSKPRWQRFIIVVMGPTMNVTMAILLLAGLYRYHFPKPALEEQPARVGGVEPDSPAAGAGILPNDLVVRLDGIQNPKWEDVKFKILTAVGETIPVEVLRNGQKVSLNLTPRAAGREQVGYAGWLPYIPAIVAVVDPGLPAGRAGLKPGDHILAADGHEIDYSPDLVQMLQVGNGKEVDFAVDRGGKRLHVFIRPVYTELGGEKKWRIGVAFRNEMAIRKLPWGNALVSSLRDNGRNCLAFFDVLAKILTRRLSTRSLAGPIGIAQLSGEAYRAGIPELLMVVSFISLQLGILNLLPIPILDGGVIMLLLIEGLIGRDLSLKVKERVVQVGMVFLLLLAVFLVYNDIVKTLKPY